MRCISKIILEQNFYKDFANPLIYNGFSVATFTKDDYKVVIRVDMGLAQWKE